MPTLNRLSLSLTLSLLAPIAAGAQRPVEVAPNAPADVPVGVAAECQRDAMNLAMAPYVARARATYPAARARFLAGLPRGHTFFVTTRLSDAAGHSEQVFIAVDSIADGRIAGRIWNHVMLVAGYRIGQRYALAEPDLVDWLIARPDGSEEGNVVGNFMDTYRPPASCGKS